MSSSAVHAQGTLLQRSTDGGSNYTTIAEITDHNIDFSGDELDTSNHQTTVKFREKLIGLLDLGVSFDVNYLPNNATHDESTGLMYDYLNKTLRYFKLIHVSGVGNKQIIFTARVSGISVPIPVDGKLTGSITLSNSGDPTLS